MRSNAKTLLLASVVAMTLAVPALAQSYYYRSKPEVSPPRPFSFQPISAAEPGSAAVSEIVRVTGHANSTASVSGGEYQICATPHCSDQGERWLTGPTSALRGDFYARLRTVVGTYGTTAGAILTVGTSPASFLVTARDRKTAPDQVDFPPSEGVEPERASYSIARALTGHDGVALSASGGGYQICSTSSCSEMDGRPATTSTTSEVAAGTLVRLVAIPSGFGQSSTVTLTAGGMVTTFTATARAARITPELVTFPARTGDRAGNQVHSEIRQLRNHDGVQVSVSGETSTVRVCGDASCNSVITGFSSSATAPNNAWVQMRQSAPAAGTTRTATLTYGTRTATWSVTSEAAADCTKGAVGTACADGAIYAGTYSGYRMYVAATNSDYVAFKTTQTASSGVTSNTDGPGNTSRLVSLGSHPAASYCRSLGSTWYLPALYELEAAWRSLNPAGIMPTAHYISSTSTAPTSAWRISYADGRRQEAQKDWGFHTARCMRR